jgi:hypothetical protein
VFHNVQIAFKFSQIRKLGRRISEVVIAGSMEIWSQYTKNHERGERAEANQMIAEEIRNIEDRDLEGGGRAEGEEGSGNDELDYEEVDANAGESEREASAHAID